MLSIKDKRHHQSQNLIWSIYLTWVDRSNQVLKKFSHKDLLEGMDEIAETKLQI